MLMASASAGSAQIGTLSIVARFANSAKAPIGNVEVQWLLSHICEESTAVRSAARALLDWDSTSCC